MCGIFGFVSSEPQGIEQTRRITNQLFKLSESRGKEASGLTIIPSGDLQDMFVVRSARPASALIRSNEYNSMFRQALGERRSRDSGMALFGHTRLVTNGSQTQAQNNQPVVYEGGILVHNGIVVNVAELWEQNPDLHRRSDVDSEIIVALVRKYARQGNSPIEAVRRAFALIRGTASVALTFDDLRILVLATNNGSLYTATHPTTGATYFASESFILRKLVASLGANAESEFLIAQIPPQQGLVIDLNTTEQHPFLLTQDRQDLEFTPATSVRRIVDKSIGKADADSMPVQRSAIVPADVEAMFARSLEATKRLRRCTKCIIPETFPFITFDASGTCSLCRGYRKIELKGEKALEERVAPYRQRHGRPDCVAALSGGRDSVYALHYLVRHLGLKPITYTYDWGMVTDLARRNVSRVCSSLGIENVIISADIRRKRDNIRKNVAAWLKKPHPGMVPLFMAGDKEFIWHAQRIKKQNDVELDVFSFNLLERAAFKEEYSGAQLWNPEDSNQLNEKLRMLPRFKLAKFYSSQFLTNPGYLNPSLFDTLWGFIAYYFMPHTFLPLFDYIPWREDEVVSLIRREFDWELATDTPSSWRIGDGTAAFYNYIYLVLGGFTENDTLRSNQIREGHLDRDTGLALSHRDNHARWDSLQWYTDVIGLDLASTLRRIHEAPKQHPLLYAS